MCYIKVHVYIHMAQITCAMSKIMCAHALNVQSQTCGKQTLYKTTAFLYKPWLTLFDFIFFSQDFLKHWVELAMYMK